MAEIATEKESAEKKGKEKLEISAADMNLGDGSQIICKNEKFHELSASNELPGVEITKGFVRCIKNDNEVSDNINTDYYSNFNLDDDMQILKTIDNIKHRSMEEDITERNVKLENEITNNALLQNKNFRCPEKEPLNNPADEIHNPNLRCPGKKSLNNPADEIYNPESNPMNIYDVELSDGVRDLIDRLLNPDPQKRLRSLLSLQNIRFFKDTNFSDIRVKKIAPADVLMKHFPNGPIINKHRYQVTYDSFAEFDTDFM